jgi:hypothetical protein
MAMKLLPFHNQFVSDFPANDQNDNLVAFNIIQRPQLPSPKLKFGKRVGSQSFDGFCGLCRLVQETRLYGRLQDLSLAGRERLELPVGVTGDGNPERHAALHAF